MMASLLDHLWQSSLFTGGAGLLALALRGNSAAVRFWLWFAASVKFLVPFAALTALSGYILAPVTPPLPGFDLLAMQPVTQPFSAATPIIAAPAVTHLDLTGVLLALWLTGFVAIALRWLVRWSKLRAPLRAAVDMGLDCPVAVKSSPSRLEPGLIGIVNPVILLPQGITRQLSGAQIDAILAHELCHWRRHDNLLAAIHMLVEALFWFFPLVWWLGARLNAERERACDESVLAQGNDPQAYAESILTICRIYLQSPLACVAGISGAGLKQRIDVIMENRLSLRLNGWRKLLLAASAALVVGSPLALGLTVSPVAVSRTSSAVPASEPPAAMNAVRRSEQAVPRKAVPFDPAHFDKYVGYYQTSPNMFATVTRSGGHFFSRLTGQVAVEFFPESETKFFATVVPAQISFISDAQGRVTELIVHQNGQEAHSPRISEAAAKAIEATLATRIRANKPSPGTEAALRHQIDVMESGKRDYSVLMPNLASAAREQEPVILAAISNLGALKAIAFKSVTPGGMDVYSVDFERGQAEWMISPLTADGKISVMAWHRLP